MLDGDEVVESVRVERAQLGRAGRVSSMRIAASRHVGPLAQLGRRAGLWPFFVRPCAAHSAVSRAAVTEHAVESRVERRAAAVGISVAGVSTGSKSCPEFRPSCCRSHSI